jgi:hypothetical protein
VEKRAEASAQALGSLAARPFFLFSVFSVFSRKMDGNYPWNNNKYVNIIYYI